MAHGKGRRMVNKEHNPQGLTPKFNNLNQTALIPVGVDAVVMCPFGYKFGIDWSQYRKCCRQECHGGCSMEDYIACRDLNQIDT